jgi:hypothetical protein
MAWLARFSDWTLPLNGFKQFPCMLRLEHGFGVMKKRNSQFNPKRKIRKLEECDFASLAELAAQAQYGGNPEHKKIQVISN